MEYEALKKFNTAYERIYVAANKGTLPHGILVECTNEQAGLELARYVASCLVCGGADKPCGVCSNCQKSQKNGHPDIFETDGIKGKSKNFSVDAVREIRSDALILPNESDCKVYILKNGQNMNEQAQNALLKILEEPPKNVYFIIVTQTKSAMLETVLSRVSVYSLTCEDGEIDERTKECVKGFIKALLCIDELRLMEQTAVFQKDSRLARDILVLLSEVFRDALVKKSGFSRAFRFNEEVLLLCGAFTSKSLLQLINVCNELIESVDRNCNNNLLTIRMCYEFKRAIGR